MKTLPTISLLLLLTSCASPLVPRDHSDCLPSEKVPSSYKTDCDKLGLKEYQCRNFYEKKINLKKQKKFKKLGIDLFQNGQLKYLDNYKGKALYADAVIHGKVVGVTYDTPNVRYISTFKIKVKDVMKGRYLRKHKYVYVKTMSGKIGAERSIHVSHEPSFAIGEEVFIYLNRITKKEAEKIKKHSKGAIFNFDLDSPITFVPYHRATVDGYAIPSESGWVNSFRAKWNILKTVRVNEKDSFCEVYPSD